VQDRATGTATDPQWFGSHPMYKDVVRAAVQEDHAEWEDAVYSERKVQRRDAWDGPPASYAAVAAASEEQLPEEKRVVVPPVSEEAQALFEIRDARTQQPPRRPPPVPVPETQALHSGPSAQVLSDQVEITGTVPRSLVRRFWNFFGPTSRRPSRGFRDQDSSSQSRKKRRQHA